ncbi:hypothetical protein TanjilG_14451 [Lupinus angustifolius]|uniref:Uncharacterized protein n=1 Tax=Lupinus angustifolius TaxID=3871 RepID=A0A1J7HYH8_LUPAN|nr:PREDICTED: uncharacterized protein LOC109352605 [Lupinus angustifolius]OIW07505.1 hypothetical protein TanjilG_14451 [Lupinus angustifolius]
MDLRHCTHNVHYINAIKGGSVTKELNVTRGKPTLSFRDLADIDGDVKTEHVAGFIARRTVKAEPDSPVCNANGSRSCDYEDNDFENITLKQFQEKCKTRKRKYSHSIDSCKGKIKIEVPSSPEDNGEKQMSPDDSDLVETLSSWRSKLPKKMKIEKRKCIEDPIYSDAQEVIPVVDLEDIQIGQEFGHSSGDLLALVEVKSEVPETDCMDHSMKLSNDSGSSSACDGLDFYSGMVDKDETEIKHGFYLENELNYVSEERDDLIPLRMAWASCTDTVVSNPEFTNGQSLNFPAIEFASEKCITQPDVHHISPEVISLVEHHHSSVSENQPDGDTSISLPNVAIPEYPDYEDLGYRDDSIFLSDCSKNEFTSDAEVQAKTSSNTEHGFNSGGSFISSSDDSSESKEKQLFSSIPENGGDQKTEATDELISTDEHCSSDLDCPRRLLSNRKSMPPPSQERLCKAMQMIDICDEDPFKYRGKLEFGEQSDKNGTAEGLDEPTKARSAKNRNEMTFSTKMFRLRKEFQSIRDCPNSTSIAFSKRQMRDAEILTTKLTKELKSMTDIVEDMLRSEFCLNTPLRYKVNEARLAVKNATRTEETTNRCLSIMSRNCIRFCRLMKLAEEDGPVPQEVTQKVRKKVVFADEVGGNLCQVKFYDDADQTSFSESN